ncbi:GrpB family protein [Streptomyces sp. NPDC057302]|uniref:GrpB family protein n=1 Tax=Streptomyces sp. NPDC057302 TaxID=3346094 RepID=UPI00362C9764
MPERPEREAPRIPMTAEEIDAAHLVVPPKLNGQVTLREYDPQWPVVFEREADRMRECLGHVGHRIEHVGSTSVPDLPAKPVIDMLLTVPDPGDESHYVPALQGLGFTLVIREPQWYEHRVLRKHSLDPSAESANLHVLPEDCQEAVRMLRFRNRLRTDSGDRKLYADAKRSLSRQSWKYMQNYADAKSDVVAAILDRPMAGESSESDT